MSDLIDEAVLEDLIARIAEDVPVPARGAEYAVDNIVNTITPGRADRARVVASVLAVAAVLAGIALAVPMLAGSSSSKSASTAAPAPAPAPNGGTAPGGGRSGPDPSLPVDGAKIVKTGTLDLQVPHATLRLAVNRVSGVAVGLGGYISDSKTNFGSDATAQITIRVPVAKFENAITQLDALPDVKVLGESENGNDVTNQYADLKAQLAAATSERDALLVVLSRAQSIGDILSVRDRVTTSQAEVNQLQGRINLLDRQATFSSLAVTLSERTASGAPVVHGRSGLAKAWWDARHGFTSVVEWLLARSGAALIIVLFALALLFGIRYLYPIVRRGLV
ncbi:MAG: hypothetical protein QOG65_3832 [Actinomycetota bacterium]|jgi:hypothetical protein|nr:hypothetical protein [Actinomycetota bacterium]